MASRTPRARRTPRDRGGAVLAPLAVLGAAAAALAYVGAVDPGQPGHYPPCPVLALTGLLCPACGGLRSIHALVRGDPAAALGANAAVVAALVPGAVGWLMWMVRSVREGGVSAVPPDRVRVLRPWALFLRPWAVAAVLAVFTAVRNLPFGTALAP